MKCEEKIDLAELEEIFSRLLSTDFDKLPKWKYDELKDKLNSVANDIIKARIKEIEEKDTYLQELIAKNNELKKKIQELEKEESELRSKIWDYKCQISNSIKQEIRSKVDKKLLEILTI